MSSQPASLGWAPHRAATAWRWPFALAALALASAAALLAGWSPIYFSIATVFLFAGPHNWLELRYFLTRMPARWGRLRVFFIFAFAGVFGLTAAFAGLVVLSGNMRIDGAFGQDRVLALWITGLLLWVAVLVHMRSRQNPRREWGWFWPLTFVLIAVVWLIPAEWGGAALASLALVYLHPLMAFWLLDRELKRSRPAWRPAFHACLLCLPAFLGLLWWKLADAPDLPDADKLYQAITSHAGHGILLGVSSHLLVATHTFLEMLHYGVWVLAIPLIGYRVAPWKLNAVPMARRSPAWRWGLYAFLAAGVLVVVVLWACFLADYTLTRNVYFTVALLHVLAEAPFLLRAL
jgi:hypothetical protein